MVASAVVAWVEGFVRSGHLADIALAVLLVEVAASQLWRRRTVRFRKHPALLANLLAGVFLLIALRAALAGWPAVIVVAGLSGALLAHVVDLRARLRDASELASLRKADDDARRGPDQEQSSRGPG